MSTNTVRHENKGDRGRTTNKTGIVESDEYEEVEVVVEEEVDDEYISSELLPGISEEEEDDEQSYNTGPRNDSSVFSTTEVEVEDDLSEILDETIVEETENVELDGSVVDEITLREEDLLLTEEDFVKSCQISVETKEARSTDDEITMLEDDDEEDGVQASSEELAEAIEYILRQEKAVSRYILTEEQAKVMTTLPLKIMKLIVDHLETCDNAGTDIDWDFLLKIVLPFCNDEDAAGEDDSDRNEDDAISGQCIPITS